MAITHLKIEQASTPETVSAAIIEKLAELAHGNLDAGSNLSGVLNANKAYRDSCEFLVNKFSPNLGINVPNGNYYIRFADAEVERVCKTQWGDGFGLIESIGHAITTIGTAFKENSEIQEFNELDSAFPLVTHLDYDAFQGCSSIEHIDLSNIQTILNFGTMNLVSTFSGCTKLEEIHMPDLQYSFFRDTFANNCTSLKSVDLPNYIGCWPGDEGARPVRDAFAGCTSLEYVNFGKASNLKFECPDKWHQGAFVNLPNLKIVDCGNQLSDMNSRSFINTPNLKAVVIRNQSTPPAAGMVEGSPSVANIFGGSNCLIYVPSTMISVYQADSFWSAISANLRPIEDYDKDAILAGN